MNALLLSALSGSAQSGNSPLNNKNTRAEDFSFADLLDQQTDLLDPQLLEALQALIAGGQTQPEQLEQLKALGFTPGQIDQLATQLTTFADKSLGAAVQNHKTLATHATDDGTDFINSTLFIARESNALRQAKYTVNTLDPNPVLAQRTADNNSTALADNSVRLNLLNTTATEDRQSNQGKALATAQLLSNTESDRTAATPKTIMNQAVEINLNATATLTPTGLNTASAVTPTYSAHIPTSLHQNTQWSADFSRVMVQMTQQSAQTPGIQTAEIRLDPPELGPLRIVLSVTDSIANAMIYAAHAQTRHSVEQALPQLQQQLAQAGLSLGEANVSDQGFFAQSEQQSNEQKDNQATFSLDNTDQSSDNSSILALNTESQAADPNAIIDTFA